MTRRQIVSPTVTAAISAAILAVCAAGPQSQAQALFNAKAEPMLAEALHTEVAERHRLYGQGIGCPFIAGKGSKANELRHRFVADVFDGMVEAGQIKLAGYRAGHPVFVSVSEA